MPNDPIIPRPFPPPGKAYPMSNNFPRHITLEGPAVIYSVDNLWHVTIHHTEADAANAARDLMELRIANPVYIAMMPRTCLFIAYPCHPIQPEDP